MLQAMRKHAKFFYILFFIVILSFIFWGVGTNDVSKTAVTVAEIGEDKITIDEYWDSYNRAREFYRIVMKEGFTEETEKKLNLRQKVLDTLIDETVLMAEARKAGIKVRDSEVEEAILNDPSFVREGRFSKEIYVRALQLNRMTPEYFESLKRKELTINKMRRMIAEAVDVTGADMPQAPSGEQAAAARQSALFEMRDKAVKSYISGLKKQMKIKVNDQLIS